MKKSLFMKAVIIGIIFLFIGTNIMPSINGNLSIGKQTEQEQQFISQMQDENSLICGYVHDTNTGDPLLYVDVQQYWQNAQGESGWNETLTDSDGFYLINTAAVDFRLYFYYENYFTEHSPMISIGENEIFWYNISLVLVPPATVDFNGFITDNISGEPLVEAEIQLNWHDNEGHYWSNYTESDETGYYWIGGIPGITNIYVNKENYYDYYSDEFFTENNSLIWLNLSLIPYPPVSAVVCGYITDKQTGDPIPDVDVNLNCITEYGYFDNHTNTNEIGFYSVGTIPGTVYIYVYKQDYASSHSEDYDISENQTFWINLTMEYQPTGNSVIQGYIVDNQTFSTVRSAFVRFDWKDDIGHFYTKYTFTNQKGFYQIQVPQGTIRLLVTANGYVDQQTSWFKIYDDTELWYNFSLSPQITLEITKPQPGLYVNNASRFPILFKFISLFLSNMKPLIIGPIEIMVNITKSTLGCDRVEFYIDGSYRWTDSKEPFTYYWNATGFSKHKIRVIAYDIAGPCTIETIMVRKLS